MPVSQSDELSGPSAEKRNEARDDPPLSISAFELDRQKQENAVACREPEMRLRDNNGVDHCSHTVRRRPHSSGKRIHSANSDRNPRRSRVESKRDCSDDTRSIWRRRFDDNLTCVAAKDFRYDQRVTQLENQGIRLSTEERCYSAHYTPAPHGERPDICLTRA